MPSTPSNGECQEQNFTRVLYVTIFSRFPLNDVKCGGNNRNIWLHSHITDSLKKTELYEQQTVVAGCPQENFELFFMRENWRTEQYHNESCDKSVIHKKKTIDLTNLHLLSFEIWHQQQTHKKNSDKSTVQLCAVKTFITTFSS